MRPSPAGREAGKVSPGAVSLRGLRGWQGVRRGGEVHKPMQAGYTGHSAPVPPGETPYNRPLAVAMMPELGDSTTARARPSGRVSSTVHATRQLLTAACKAGSSATHVAGRLNRKCENVTGSAEAVGCRGCACQQHARPQRCRGFPCRATRCDRLASHLAGQACATSRGTPP